MLTLEFTSCYTTVSAPCNILYNSALCSIEIPLKPISALNLTSGYSVHLKSECNDILKKNVSGSSLFFRFFIIKRMFQTKIGIQTPDSKNEVCCSRNRHSSSFFCCKGRNDAWRECCLGWKSYKTGQQCWRRYWKSCNRWQGRRCIFYWGGQR